MVSQFFYKLWVMKESKRSQGVFFLWMLGTLEDIELTARHFDNCKKLQTYE